VEAVSTTSKDLVNDVPVTPSHISNFALVPNSVEELIAVKFDAPCCLPPLLATAAFIAPRLQSLCLISGGCIDIGGSELRYLPLFSNLVELDLGAWCLEEYGSSVDLGYLSCAHSLKIVTFDDLVLDEVTPELAQEFWSTLAALSNLDAVILRGNTMAELDQSFFPDSVSLLTQIRSLTLGYVHRSFCYSDDHDGHLHSSIGTLTQLTAFSSGWQSSARCFDSILKLVRLESLLVELSTWHKKDSIPPGLPKLTCLLVHGPNRRQEVFIPSAAHFLPPDTPAFANQHLALAGVWHWQV